MVRSVENARRSRPGLPHKLYVPAWYGTLSLLAYAACLAGIPMYLLFLVLDSGGSLPLRGLIAIPLILVAAFGLNLMGFVGHEGMHLSLCRNKYISALIALLYSSAVISYFEMGFAVQHWTHHRFTNQPSDHDIALVRGLKTWWSRLLLSRWIYNWEYLRNTVCMAVGYPNPFSYKLPFTSRELHWLARANLLLAALWLTIYVGAILSLGPAGFLTVALPMVTVLFIAACQTYIDHAGTNSQLFHNAWSRTSWLMTLAYFGANYHLEHHLYPGIPCYRLPYVHRLLQVNGTYTGMKPPVERGFLRAFRNLAAPYEPGEIDSEFDPFVTR
jgi:beta-carotene hydroxylase